MNLKVKEKSAAHILLTTLAATWSPRNWKYSLDLL